MDNVNNDTAMIFSSNDFKKVITHGGTFHADEVFATAWLMYSTGLDSLEVERTFKISEEDLENPDVLIYDIGGKYSPVNNNFDHHMKDGVMRASGIPFSSFGLVYDAFPKKGMSEAVEETIRQKLVYPIDVIDNGIGEKGELPEYSLSQVISLYNPLDGRTGVDDCFREAVELAHMILLKEIDLAEKQERDVSGVLNSKIVEGRILMMDECYAGWQKTVLENFSEQFLYCIYPGLRGGYIIQCIPVKEGSFDTRKSLPTKWAGLRDSELRDISGVEDATFVHPGRFIGGAETVAGCLAMAKSAIYEF